MTLVPEAVTVPVPAVALAVTVTVATDCPAGIVTLGAENVTIPLGLAARVITWPPAGAGLLKVTVRVVEALVPKLKGDGERTIAMEVTVTESVAEVSPAPDAVMVSVPAVVSELTVTLPVVCPAAIVTLGTEKVTRPFVLAKFTT